MGIVSEVSQRGRPGNREARDRKRGMELEMGLIWKRNWIELKLLTSEDKADTSAIWQQAASTRPHWI